MAKKKKKISSEDFLKMMEDQEDPTHAKAFSPDAEPEAKASAKQKMASKQQKRDFKKRELTPIQKELLQFVIKRTPKVVLSSAERAQKIILGVEKLLRRNV